MNLHGPTYRYEQASTLTCWPNGSPNAPERDEAAACMASFVERDHLLFFVYVGSWALFLGCFACRRRLLQNADQIASIEKVRDKYQRW